jgi:ketosteroid isomerase-like protein
MTQENVEIVRRMYDAFYSGDADGALAHFDPEVVVDASKGRPRGRRATGVGRASELIPSARQRSNRRSV